MGPARLIAALSFEDRATCGVVELADRIQELVMLDYGSRRGGLESKHGTRSAISGSGRQ
jgi:hypothetical protein